MAYTLHSNISYEELLNNWNDDINLLKRRTKILIKNASPNVTSRNLFMALVDFYFDYAIKKGVNPLIPIIHTAIITNYLSDRTIGTDGVEYKNTAKITVNNNIFENYTIVNNQIPTFLYQKFKGWTDSIRAQVDHLALYMCSDLSEAEPRLYVTRLTFDPNYDYNRIGYLHINDNGTHFTQPTIHGMAIMLNNTDGCITNSGMQMVNYEMKFTDLLNRIVFDNTNGLKLTSAEKLPFSANSSSYSTSEAIVADANNEVKKIMRISKTIKTTLLEIKKNSQDILLKRII